MSTFCHLNFIIDNLFYVGDVMSFPKGCFVELSSV